MRGSLNLWLLVILAVCALSFWFGKDLILPGGASEEGGTTVPGTKGLPEKIVEPVHLMVLNGTSEDGLARDFGLLLGRTGCVVENVGNAPHGNYAESFLVNRTLSRARAEQFAAHLGGLPIIREYDGRSTADAVLVLGRDCERIRKKLMQSGS